MKVHEWTQWWLQSQSLVLGFSPGNKYEQDTPAPSTHSRSASLRTVRPRGTTKEREGGKGQKALLHYMDQSNLETSKKKQQKKHKAVLGQQ